MLVIELCAGEDEGIHYLDKEFLEIQERVVDDDGDGHRGDLH